MTEGQGLVRTRPSILRYFLQTQSCLGWDASVSLCFLLRAEVTLGKQVATE